MDVCVSESVCENDLKQEKKDKMKKRQRKLKITHQIKKVPSLTTFAYPNMSPASKTTQYAFPCLELLN